MTNEQHRPEPLADSVADAARRIGCSRATAYNLINSGLLIAKKLGRRTLIERSEQARFVASLPAMPVAARQDA